VARARQTSPTPRREHLVLVQCCPQPYLISSIISLAESSESRCGVIVLYEATSLFCVAPLKHGTEGFQLLIAGPIYFLQVITWGLRALIELLDPQQVAHFSFDAHTSRTRRPRAGSEVDVEPGPGTASIVVLWDSETAAAAGGGTGSATKGRVCEALRRRFGESMTVNHQIVV
jgi:hypothetical protein